MSWDKRFCEHVKYTFPFTILLFFLFYWFPFFLFAPFLCIPISKANITPLCILVALEIKRNFFILLFFIIIFIQFQLLKIYSRDFLLSGFGANETLKELKIRKKLERNKYFFLFAFHWKMMWKLGVIMFDRFLFISISLWFLIFKFWVTVQIILLMGFSDDLISCALACTVGMFITDDIG